MVQGAIDPVVQGIKTGQLAGIYRKSDLAGGMQMCQIVPKTPRAQGGNPTYNTVCMQKLSNQKFRGIPRVLHMKRGYQEHAYGLSQCWIEADASVPRWKWRILVPKVKAKSGIGHCR